MDADPLDEGAAVALQAATVATQLAQTLIRQAQEAAARRTAEARLDYQEASEHLAAQAEVAAAFYERASAPQWISAAEVDDVAAVVEGVHLWAEVDEERFGSLAHKIRDNVHQVHGIDLPTAFTEQANAARLADLARVGITHAHDLATDTTTASVPTPTPATAAAVSTDPSVGLNDYAGDYDSPAARLERARTLEAAGASPGYRQGRAAADALNAHSPLQAAAAGLSAARSGKAGPGLPRAVAVLEETDRDR